MYNNPMLPGLLIVDMEPLIYNLKGSNLHILDIITPQEILQTIASSHIDADPVDVVLNVFEIKILQFEPSNDEISKICFEIEKIGQIYQNYINSYTGSVSISSWFWFDCWLTPTWMQLRSKL